MTNHTEIRVLTFRVPSGYAIPETSGGSKTLDFNLLRPETTSEIGEGWEPVSHQILTIGEELLVTILVQRKTIDQL